MNNELIRNADICYYLAEKRAMDYFQDLYQQVMKKSYIPILMKDIQWWKQKHIHRFSIFSIIFRNNRKPDSKEYHNYIRWLDHSGKLDEYLYRSISYIFMRDLGKELDSSEVQGKVNDAVKDIKKYLTNSTKSYRENEGENISMASLYRKAQEEGVESAVIWLVDKLKTVSSNIPEGMDAENAQRKLIKIIAGVLMHEVEDIGDEVLAEDRTKRIDRAIRLGYCYGLTYPFIDDLLDSNVLSDEEKKQYSDLIRTTLINKSVSELGKWKGDNVNLIRYIHSELKEAFEYIKANQQPENMKSFFDQSYVFFNSQELDRKKDLANGNYTNEDIYIPVILKAASSRLIVRSIISAPEDKGFDNLTFFYGIYNQLADDFADMFDDMEQGAVTPYTYYLKYHEKRSDLINPFELYWTVISNLIHNVYHSDLKTCEVILARAINGLKRYKQRMGNEKYNEVMKIFDFGEMRFNSIIQWAVKKADDVDFFDKLLRDHIIYIIKSQQKEQEDFKNTVKCIRDKINRMLKISKDANTPLIGEKIIDAANYSLEGDGKRLRSIVTWVMGVNEYGLKKKAIIPLLKSLEYMHTASLIFDDLPSQDNAFTRRGRPTLHNVYNSAAAELTGLFLTQKAVEEQTYLNEFDPEIILSLIRYSTQITEKMCMGQAMDLNSKGKQLTIEQLSNISFYKTGLAFEASLVMPAILGNASEVEIESLKKFACSAGIVFQIKDDLLDVEGDSKLLGKQIGKDAENNTSTFVSILGKEGAKKEMWEHYCLAVDALQSVPRNTTFLKHLLNYFMNRNY